MADNFTFLDGSGVSKTARAVDNSSVWLPATVIASAAGVPVADDDAVAAGPIFPVAGIYQATVDEVDAGDIGRVRMTARRARVVSNDLRPITADNSYVTGAGDMQVSTTNWYSGYATPTTAFFNGADAGFNASERFIRVPMLSAGFSKLAIQFANNLAVNVTLKIYVGEVALNVIYNASLASGAFGLYTPFAGGTGADATVITIAALQFFPYSYLFLGITPASDPSSGAISISIFRG